MSYKRRWAVRRCDRFLAISNFSAQWLAARAHLNRSRIRVIALPIDQELAEIALAQSPPAAKACEPLLLTVARMDRDARYKGLFDIAESLPAVKEEVPKLRWEVVGDGPARAELEQRCRQLGLQSVVTFLGRIGDSQLIDAYCRASVFVMPSVASPEAMPPTGEGFGLVYAEAGAFGVPSLASSAGGGSAEVVIDGHTGLLVPPSNPGALSQAIVRLLSDSELRRRLGDGARERVRARHLPAQFARELKTALAEAASGLDE
jgi:phosphatidylinositol alpha-1,6-mannosyltransferase